MGDQEELGLEAELGSVTRRGCLMPGNRPDFGLRSPCCHFPGD